MPRTSTRAVALCLVLGLISACGSIDRELQAPRVSNGTDVPLSLFVEQEDGLVSLSTIPSGVTVQLGVYESQCTREPLVAVAPDGREVGRRVDPICPDETWLIEN